MNEWCGCGFVNSFMSLEPSNLEGNQSWVHSKCGKPTFEVWQTHEKYCDECGRSFSSPYSDVCAPCSPETLVTWYHALVKTALIRPVGQAASIVQKIAA